ncbi:MAG: hypothetical protein JRF63_04745 [Deltaproteobacteria bacterium]|nr:hypothetical protein [Deltaproteobacteria bacterium]
MWLARSLRLLAISLFYIASTSSCREPLTDPAAKPVYPVEEEVVVVEPQPLPPSTGRFQVCGNLDVDKPDYRFSSAKLEDFPMDPSELVQHLPGPFSMVLLDGDGRVLSEEKFGPMGGHAASIGPDGKMDCHPVMISFSCMYVPFVPGVVRLQVRQNETVLESVTRSKHAPELRITSPVPHSGLPKKGKLKIAWEALDADGDILSHSIYYRSGPGDGGLGNWEVVIGDFAEARMDLDASFFAPGPAPELMILTTDRFNTTRAVVEL